MRRCPDDRERLLHGPYKAPRLHVGDQVTCLFRDCDIVVTGCTDAPISWPRGLPVGAKGHPSLLVDEDLARAVRTESAAAIYFWWGVSVGVAWRWRKALGVRRMDNPGSRRLVLAASAKGAAAVRGPGPTQPQVERRRQWRERNLARRWTAADAALLGTLPDAEVARRTGRSENAVRQKRELLGVHNPTAWRANPQPRRRPRKRADMPEGPPPGPRMKSRRTGDD